MTIIKSKPSLSRATDVSVQGSVQGSVQESAQDSAKVTAQPSDQTSVRAERYSTPALVPTLLSLAIAVGVAVQALGSPASACPAFLQGVQSNSLRLIDAKTGELVNNGDVCAFHDRFERARQAIRAKNVDPDMIANSRAPRLIDMKTWDQHVSGFLDIFGSYDPHRVYRDPQGNWTVWPGWNAAALYVDALGQQNYRALSEDVSQIAPMTLPWITDIHIRALATSEPGLAGKIRTGKELGTNFYRASASKISEIAAVENNEYKSLLHPGQALVTFRKTACFEDLSRADQKIVGDGHNRVRVTDPLDANPGKDFKDSKGVVRHCGYFVYADPDEVLAQLDLLFADIGKRMNSFTVGRTFAWQVGANLAPQVGGFTSEDPLLIAARAQRWYVSIHPFGGGNGRTSRFFMDYITESLGLPATTVENMNQDIIVSESQWAQQIGIGMERVVRILEDCAVSVHSSRCEVSDKVYAEQVKLSRN